MNAPQCDYCAVMKFGGGRYQQAANCREQLRAPEDRLCTEVLCKYSAYYLGKDVAPVKWSNYCRLNRRTPIKLSLLHLQRCICVSRYGKLHGFEAIIESQRLIYYWKKNNSGVYTLESLLASAVSALKLVPDLQFKTIETLSDDWYFTIDTMARFMSILIMKDTTKPENESMYRTTRAGIMSVEYRALWVWKLGHAAIVEIWPRSSFRYIEFIIKSSTFNCSW